MNDASSTSDLPALKPGDSYVQSFARGLAVIRTFSAEAPRQTLTEVARRCGLTRAASNRPASGATDPPPGSVARRDGRRKQEHG